MWRVRWPAAVLDDRHQKGGQGIPSPERPMTRFRSTWKSSTTSSGVTMKSNLEASGQSRTHCDDDSNPPIPDTTHGTAIYAAPERPPVNHPWPFLGSPHYHGAFWLVGCLTPTDRHIWQSHGGSNVFSLDDLSSLLPLGPPDPQATLRSTRNCVRAW